MTSPSPDRQFLAGERHLSPTDISQYVRLDRCERFLRLHLHDRTRQGKFLHDFGVVREGIPPIMGLSGGLFETGVEEQMGRAHALRNFARDPQTDAKGTPLPDNNRVLHAATHLPAGETLLICQPSIEARLGAWNFNGKIDILRLHRNAATNALSVHIIDTKSSARVKVEHRLQVAFYAAMIEQMLGEAGVDTDTIQTAILYRGEAAEEADEAGRERKAQEQAEAQRLVGATEAYLEVIADSDAYRAEVESLVTGAKSDAQRIATAPFDALFYALGLKCDNCLYNQFCLKDADEQGDLALLPYLAARDKKALHSVGVRTVHDLAHLKELGDVDGRRELIATSQGENLLRRLASTTVGPRIDELILRARASRAVRRREPGITSLSYIPSKGHTTLPHTDAAHNPNLVCVYVDAQNDFTQDRVYLLGALVVAHENGVAIRRERVVHITETPPDTPEKEAALFGDWIRDLLRAVVSLAAPDAEGAEKAPVHLIFWNDWGQQTLLDALARNFGAMVAAAPALYDFMTQMAAFDSPVATFLDEEIRERRNYPMLCQSLQAVASYLRFAWDDERSEEQDTDTAPPLRQLFHERLFDTGGKRVETDEAGEATEIMYNRRSRHNSQIPLEYAYAAWDALPPPGVREDTFAPYRAATLADLVRLQKRRLDAVAHIAAQIPGNALTQKTAFVLPDLATFTDRADHLAAALREFVTIERHSFLTEWKTGRQLPPERRVLHGETLLVTYLDADQDEDIAVQNSENMERRALETRFRDEYKQTHPNAKKVMLSPDQKAQCKWSMEGITFRLRLVTENVDADLDTLLGLANIKEGGRVVVAPRWDTDSRLPPDQRVPYTPTPKQMLYGMRVELVSIKIERDGDGRALEAFAVVKPTGAGGGGSIFLFGGDDKPWRNGETYTLDPDPNDISGFWHSKVAGGLCDLENTSQTTRHTLYHRLAHPDRSEATVPLPPAARDGQSRFLDGLDAFEEAGLLHKFEAGKRDYIGGNSDAPILLVQGPPGTGKSYSTAFATLARMQGAMAAHVSLRVMLSCKTHSATDVLLRGIADALDELARLKARRPDIWDAHFDDRLLALPLFRVDGKGADTHPRIEALLKDVQRERGQSRCADDIAGEPWVIAAATPGAIYTLVKTRWGDGDKLFGGNLCDLVILDEASQMSLPEAMLATLPLAPDGRLIVVGDPRQMPPIVHHGWDNEPRRTFGEFRAFASLFDTLVALKPPFIQFAESFRLHSEMARFLRDGIYIHDGINYHSLKQGVLKDPATPHTDPFVRAVLDPAFPLIVVVHDEAQSQTRNTFEETLIGPVLRALAGLEGHNLEARHGLGVVVPHRAQRTGLQQAYPELRVIDQVTGQILVEAVDTVERYQGDEREVILISATESDPEYLHASAGFLLDPRRLTVALSRAKKKMVLVASRSIFSYFTNDDDLFASAQLWKNLLRRTCTTRLYTGLHDGNEVEVWGG